MKKAHRILGLLVALPLAWQAVTGYILYYRFDAAGKPHAWKDLVVKLHNGEFLGRAIFVVGLVNVLLILTFVTVGFMQFFQNRKESIEPRINTDGH